MAAPNTVVAAFANHEAAEDAIKHLARSGIDMKQLSVVGKDYDTDEKIVGFYNTGDRVKFWGKYGAFWGGLWGILAGGVYVAMPAAAGVMVIGYLALG